MSTTVAGSTNKAAASASLAAPAPKYSPPPAVSFRSVLLGDDAADGAALGTPLFSEEGASFPSTVGLTPQEPPPAAAAPRAPVEMGQPLDPPCDVDALLRGHGREDAIDAPRKPRAAVGSPEALSPSGVVVAQTDVAAPPTPEVAEMARAQTSLEDLLPALVRRVQWGSDGRRGTVRMELAAGELAGGTLQVSSEDGRVRVHLGVPPGVDAGAWQARITARLAAQNIPTDHVEVS